LVYPTQPILTTKDLCKVAYNLFRYEFQDNCMYPPTIVTLYTSQDIVATSSS